MAFSFDPMALIGSIADAQAQAAATQLGYANLAFQKEQARKQYGLATAGRTDAYGNEQSFDDVLKKWIMSLTPTQKQLVKAGEREQLLSLTEDATRNRDVRRRQAERAEGAGEDFNEAMTGYRYDQPPGEEAIFGELVGLLGAANERRRATATEGLGRQALRLGKGASIPAIVKSSMDELGATLPDSILQAREKALGESQGRVAAHQAKYLDPAKTFAQLMDAVGTAPIMFSDAPGRMDVQQQQMLNSIANALAQGASGVGNAYSNLANIVRQSPRFSGLSFSGDLGGGGQSTPRPLYAPSQSSDEDLFAQRGRTFVDF